MKILAINPQQNGKNLSNDKELAYAYSLVGVKAGKPIDVATVRMWVGRRADGIGKLYCTIWAGNDAVHTAGHGSVSGCGYHKPSAALDSAFRSAGIEMDTHIDGVGEAAMEAALIALGVKLGYRAKSLSVFSHG